MTGVDLRRRQILLAAGGLLIPRIAGAVSLPPSAEQIELILAERAWRQFLSGEYAYDEQTLRPIGDAQYDRAMRKIATPLFNQSTRRSALDWRIGTADSDDENAFTPGGGVICMLRGIVAYCRSEVELASVIAHEVGHIEHRHAIRRILSHQIFAETIRRAKAINHKDFVRSADLHKYEALAPELIYKSYKRLDEYQADAFAVHALAKAGYDVTQAHTLFERFAGERPDRLPVDTCLLMSHPEADKRAKRMKQIARRFGKQRPRPDSDAFKYLKSAS